MRVIVFALQRYYHPLSFKYVKFILTYIYTLRNMSFVLIKLNYRMVLGSIKYLLFQAPFYMLRIQ